MSWIKVSADTSAAVRLTPVDRPGDRRRWWRVMPFAGILGVLGAAVYLVARAWGLFTPDGAVEAALVQYRQVSGIQDLRLEVTSGWSDCAIVQVGSASSGAGAVLAMTRDDDRRWRIARKSDEQVSFDTDDIRDHDSCLQVANATDPLTNGAP